MLLILVPAGPCPSASFCLVNTLNALLLFLDAVALISICLADASPAPAHIEPRVLGSCYKTFLLFYLLIYLVSTLTTHQTWIPSLQLCGLSTQYRV